MAILGIEGTAHTFGVGVVEERGGRAHILANIRAMIAPEEGIHPREAAHHHTEVAPRLVHEALAAAADAGVTIAGIAFSQGPGLGPCLRVAATVARALSLRLQVPLVGVNHCVAHLEIGRGLTDATDPVLLYASGANTQVIAQARGRYRVFGETLDIGIGNALDKIAREQGIPFPGGPAIEKLASAWSGDLLDMPYLVKGMDLSFSGIVTKSARYLADGHSMEQVCYSIQETAFASLIEVAERALAHIRKDELLLGGGVACNSRLQAMAKIMCEERGAAFFCPPRPVLVDNGAMIAWLGHLNLRAGVTTAIESSGVMPYQRTDMVEIPGATA